MNILGIDPSITRTAMVAVEFSEEYTNILDYTDMPFDTEAFMEKLDSMHLVENIELIVCEQGFGGRFGGGLSQEYIRGHVDAFCYDRWVKSVGVLPSEWRKMVYGKGSMRTAEAKQRGIDTAKLYGLRPSTKLGKPRKWSTCHDLGEAFRIAEYGWITRDER